MDDKTVAEIVELDDHRPHACFVDPVSGNAHVVPRALVESWRDGLVEPDAECVRAMISDWIRCSCAE